MVIGFTAFSLKVLLNVSSDFIQPGLFVAIEYAGNTLP
jgi:hypothetical protein